MRTRTDLHLRAALLLAGLLIIPAPAGAQTPTSSNPTCRQAVEGRIPWNKEGNKQWVPANVERLCKGGNGTEPAKCFDRLMRGQVNWGGGTQWEWENGIDLCQGARDANATISCFENQIRSKMAWKEAIPRCAGAAPAQPAQTATPVLPTLSSEQQLELCRNAVQGRVPWNKEGNKQWAQANMDRLCKDGYRDEPARCFERVAKGNVNWGGGRDWQWKNGIDLCRGSKDGDKTIACFKEQVRAKVGWEAAIAKCQPSATTGTIVGPAATTVSPAPVVATVDPNACKNAVQGKIPWNSNGDKNWSAANVDKLCTGGAGDEPAKCFAQLMSGTVDWGGGTKWEWQNGLDLCRASQDHRRTITCFQQKISAKEPWKNAIAACGRP